MFELTIHLTFGSFWLSSFLYLCSTFMWIENLVLNNGQLVQQSAALIILVSELESE